MPSAYLVWRSPPIGAASSPSNGYAREEAKARLASRLAKYKALSGGVQFVDEILRSASREAMAFELRTAMARG